MNRGGGGGDGGEETPGELPSHQPQSSFRESSPHCPLLGPAGLSSSRVKGHRTTPSHRVAQGVMCHTHVVLTTRPQGPSQASTAFVFVKRL